MKFETLRQEVKRAFNEEIEDAGGICNGSSSSTGRSVENWGGTYRKGHMTRGTFLSKVVEWIKMLR